MFFYILRGYSLYIFTVVAYSCIFPSLGKDVRTKCNYDVIFDIRRVTSTILQLNKPLVIFIPINFPLTNVNKTGNKNLIFTLFDSSTAC